MSRTALCVLLLTTVPSFASPAPEINRPARRTLRVASLMYKPIKWDKAANTQRLDKAVREAHKKGAELIVTPEGALEGYVVNEVIRASGQARRELTERFNALAEPCNGPHIRHFQRLSKQLRVHLVLGFLEADDAGTWNTAILIDPNGNITGKYRKTHFAQGYATGEDKGQNPVGYSRGTEYPVFDVNSSTMGIMICYDRRVPKVAATLVENGARFIINPSYGIKGDRNRDFVSSRASENNVPILFVHPEQTLFCDRNGKIVTDIRPGPDDPRIAIIPVNIAPESRPAPAAR